MFNDNNKLIKEHNKTIKTEKALNELIQKNKTIQTDCENINTKIDEAKIFCDDIMDRLEKIANPEMIEHLVKQFKAKNEQISECEQIQTKCVSSMEKIDQLIRKQQASVDDLKGKLEKVNPMNSATPLKDAGGDDFRETVNSKLDEARGLKEELDEMQAKLDGLVDEIERVMQPLTVLNEREVKADPEISQILEKMKSIDAELSSLETKLMPNTQKIQRQTKSVKSILDNEIARKLQQGQEQIEKVNGVIEQSAEIKNHSNKRIKVYRDLLEAALKKQGTSDPVLSEKLQELTDEVFLFEKEITEADGKLKDQLKKCQDAKKVVFDIDKEPERYLPHQLDNMLSNLEEIEEKVNSNRDRLTKADASVKAKIDDLQKLLESSDSKKELLGLIDELSTDVNTDLVKLQNELDKFPGLLEAIEVTLGQMSKATTPGDDYHEMQDEIHKWQAQIQGLKQDLVFMKKELEQQQKGKDSHKTLLKKAQNIENLRKVVEHLEKEKDNVTNIFTDAAGMMEEITDLKNKIGDCEIQSNIAKRKNELSKFASKLERMKQEFKNLKKSTVGSKDVEISKRLDEIEHKLAKFTEDKGLHQSFLLNELENAKPIDFLDFSKNHEAVKKVRELRKKIQESEQSISELEKVQKEVVRKMTEADMENSIVL